jgi:hypothetical protein
MAADAEREDGVGDGSKPRLGRGGITIEPGQCLAPPGQLDPGQRGLAGPGDGGAHCLVDCPQRADCGLHAAWEMEQYQRPVGAERGIVSDSKRSGPP